LPTWRKGLWNIIITLCPSLFLSVTFTSTFQSSALKTLGTNVTRNWMVHCIYFFLLEIPHRNQRFPHGVRKDIFCHFCGVLFSAFFFWECFVFIIQTVYWKKQLSDTDLGEPQVNILQSSGSCCYFSTFKDLYLFHL
jgi:hypothetical protein